MTRASPAQVGVPAASGKPQLVSTAQLGEPPPIEYEPLIRELADPEPGCPSSPFDNAARGRGPHSRLWRWSGPEGGSADGRWQRIVRDLVPTAPAIRLQRWLPIQWWRRDVRRGRRPRGPDPRLRRVEPGPRHPNLEAWVTTTAFHVALELPGSNAAPGDPTAPEPVECQVRISGSPTLTSCPRLRRLSSRQQQVVVWRYYFDQSVEETAVRLGLTASKVKDATHEAVTKLGRLLPSGRRASA